VASMRNFEPKQFFEITEPSEREPARVSFS
jgi:hypothetical protein